MERHNGNGNGHGNGHGLGRGAGRRVLITGGAGFVGSHLADELLAHGYRVRALDNLSEQVHGPDIARPAYLSEDVELMRGDVRDAAAVKRALQGVDAVFHFAAAVGVGQSMYEIERYTDVNNRGTAVLLEALTAAPVERLVVASSMSVYGEGLYCDPDGNPVSPPPRSPEQLGRGDWELYSHGRRLRPMPTPEAKPVVPSSVYALSKLDQELMCLMVGQAYGIPTTALRFFNIYGPRQALSNPYTGVLAIFAARYLNRRPPLVFEDGRQRRDFVSVHDVARACRLALETPQAAGQAFNVGSGRSISVLEVAEQMAQALGIEDLPPEITGKYRAGDIRHCYADISLAQQVLGYRPQVTLSDGLEELVDWIVGQNAYDRVEAAAQELARRGLQR
ncbi:NAD-dependent epimerase/dehydratase family protein [Vulcaniibacterium tengchongense]|uniref:dTDP-L-rhamnose 4-epimerase n=1 Tax=Vulcaniibacterium tengchongense TaxID=1273429 RepID=A0A3N4VVQ2_9GAMM|nr:NAD-dependent epimerase/dehydratase family protein [Vulcaniibacterium tengchongense]RPE81127.1 dTDP-L-rhamnose 4-epimerase [Vulcaniibacterium tengchongense]